MLTGSDLDHIRAAIRSELKHIADEDWKRIDQLFAPTPAFREKQLQGLAYALYLSDVNDTDPQLGRPQLSWEELAEEQQTYLRYARAAITYMKEP
jgi:hypothetical protein